MNLELAWLLHLTNSVPTINWATVCALQEALAKTPEAGTEGGRGEGKGALAEVVYEESVLKGHRPLALPNLIVSE